VPLVGIVTDMFGFVALLLVQQVDWNRMKELSVTEYYKHSVSSLGKMYIMVTVVNIVYSNERQQIKKLCIITTA
jgi:hypothetical protein